jgi:hypothetical protein
MTRRTVTFGWVGVAVIGLIFLIVVLGLQLFPRLGAAQNLIEDARPAFTADRIAGDVAGVDMVSVAVNTLDPAMYPGRADVEWPKLISLIAERTGRSEADVRDRLMRTFPYSFALLNSFPLSDASAELPAVMDFIATTLHMTMDQWRQTLAKDFPALNQMIDNAPKLTRDWNTVPGEQKMTRFDGAPVRTMPQVRDYFAKDLIPAFDRQQANFRGLDTFGGAGFLAPLLFALGIAMILFGTLMARATSRGLSDTPNKVGWAVVSVIGVTVVGLVFVLQLYPRLSGGQRMLDDARAAFTVERVEGARAGVDYAARPIDTLGPGIYWEGHAAGELIKLIGYLTQASGMTPLELKSLLTERFPHSTWLLIAAPYAEVTAENSQFYDYLATNCNWPAGQGKQEFKENFPNLSQTLTNLAALTNRWAAVPGTEKLTFFDSTPARTFPQVRDYFANDVVPVMERQQSNFVRVDTTWPPLTVFAPLLTAVGLAVTVYGLVFSFLGARRPRRRSREPDSYQPELVMAASS